MKRRSLVLAAALTGALYGQPANPLSAELLQSYTIIETNLLKMVQKDAGRGLRFQAGT